MKDRMQNGLKHKVLSRFKEVFIQFTLYFCGEKGIRTLGTITGTLAFQASPFDHSGISPFLRYRLLKYRFFFLLPKKTL
jgi:hypothetical protein